MQKREQRVKRRNVGGTASTHHAACSRPLHKRPCRLAARANERFYNSMQSPPEGPFGAYLSLSLSLILSSSSFWSSPRRLLFHFSLQPLAPFFGRVACSLPCERTSCSGVYTRAYTTLLSILPYQTDARAFIFSRTVAPRSTRIRTKNNSKSNSKWPVVSRQSVSRSISLNLFFFSS